MPDHRQPTLTDYLVVAISPGLVMLLVGSLAFFLLTSFYEGSFPGALRYITALFVFAAVLIGRISISEGAEHAALYGLPLALATWLAWNRFTDAGALMGVAIIALVWWAAHKLTWDCTVLDESEEPEHAGLWEAAGLDELLPSPAAADSAAATRAEDLDRDDEAPSRPHGPRGRWSWSQAWQRWKENQRRPHAPGVWVVYFLLATLPLFGIGQWAIPAGDDSARRSAFLFLAVYLASGLTLLSTTSFLNLRRYLRRRRLEVPAEMTAIWLGLAAGLVCTVLLVSSLLPRTRPQITWTAGLGSKSDIRANRWHLVGPDGAPPEDSSTASALEPGPGGGASTAAGRSPQPGTDKSAAAESAAGLGEARAAGNAGASGGSASREGGQSGSGSPGGAGGSPSGADPSSSTAASARNSAPEASPRSGGGGDSGKEGRSGASRTPSGSAGQGPLPPLSQAVASLASGLAQWLPWLYWLVVLAIVAGLLWRFGRPLWAALSDLIRGLCSLRWNSGPAQAAAPADGAPVPVPPSFRDFLSRWQRQASWEDGELIRYTFAALEAWSRERTVGRSDAETPWEFGRRLAGACPSIAADTLYLISQYDRLAYDPAGPHELRQDQVRRLWRALSEKQENALGSTPTP